VISHFIRAETTFHPTHTDLNYSRYRRVGDLTLNESFFPVVWTGDGRRSAWLDDAYASQTRQDARSRTASTALR
jgi:hypothetical protein